MKKILQTLAPLLFTLFIVCLPLIGIAAVGDSTAAERCSDGVCSIQNPLAVGSFCQLLKLILNAIIIIGLPIAVVFLVWVGFKFILARGNPTELEVAKRNLLYTVLGIAIFLGAWTIAQVIAATLKELGVSALNSC